MLSLLVILISFFCVNLMLEGWIAQDPCKLPNMVPFILIVPMHTLFGSFQLMPTLQALREREGKKKMQIQSKFCCMWWRERDIIKFFPTIGPHAYIFLLLLLFIFYFFMVPPLTQL